ncbi:uncharacterized protein LOC133737462 [Rosa rugosa]|uniref:uncharacterized protein LOC133737462 n=1 Tax=Rosa rugosa TaxID=74645 RepID=UPI002B417DB5|nr:uncharacterized protein LOC133737462 [Rosa rugosa]
MMKAFLEKYFPASKVIMLLKKISGIQQAQDESYATYYERFQSLIAQCPQHQMKEETLLTCFYEGLLPLKCEMLDAAAAGKTMIENRAKNAQQYAGVGQSTRRVNEVVSTTGQGGASACGVCSTQGHSTDQCPQLIENGGWESVNGIGGYQGIQGGPQRPSNFQRPQGFYQRPQVPQNFSSNSNNFSNPNYDKIIEALTNSTQALVQGQQNHTKDIADLKKQMGQVMDFMTKFHENGKLPSNTIPNPKGGFEGPTN